MLMLSQSRSITNQRLLPSEHITRVPERAGSVIFFSSLFCVLLAFLPLVL